MPGTRAAPGLEERKMADAFQRILLPTDFCELAEHAGQYARTLAERCGGQVHVLHVHTPAETLPSAPHTLPAALPPEGTDQVATLQATLATFAQNAFGDLEPDPGHARRRPAAALSPGFDEQGRGGARHVSGAAGAAAGRREPRRRAVARQRGS
jgi:hypothetical protein